MSLFDDASLVLTPNGYKASKLYSIKPTSGLGDMTVVRATSATRVNSAGLIEIARTNLALRSEQFDNAAWTTLAFNATVTANTTISPDGTQNADTVVFGASGYLYQSFAIVGLASATFSIYAKTATQRIIFGGGTAVGTDVYTTVNVGNGWFRQILTRTFTGGGTGNLQTLPFGNNVTAFLWGAQLEIGSVATEYIPTVASIRTKFAGITQDGSSASNIPRLDYTGGGCPRILVEPLRTNLLIYSEQFDNAGWNKTNTTVTANTTTSPDGTLTADKIIPNTTNGTHNVNRSITVSTSTAYTASLYAKKGEYSGLRINFISSANTFISVNLNTGVIQSFGGSIYLSSSIESVGNDWYRVTMTFLPPVATSSLNFIVENPVGTVTFAGDNTSGIYLWGAQLEVASNATSYIPTVAATVTRNADVISQTGISSLIGQTEGTFFCEMSALKNTQTAAVYMSVFASGTNFTSLGFVTGTNKIVFEGIYGGVSIFYIYNAPFNININSKIAVAYQLNKITGYVNGIKVFENTTAQSFSQTLTEFKSDYRGLGNFLEANVKSIQLYKTRLTDTELAQLTTL